MLAQGYLATSKKKKNLTIIGLTNLDQKEHFLFCSLMIAMILSQYIFNDWTIESLSNLFFFIIIIIIGMINFSS